MLLSTQNSTNSYGDDDEYKWFIYVGCVVYCFGCLIYVGSVVAIFYGFLKYAGHKDFVNSYESFEPYNNEYNCTITNMSIATCIYGCDPDSGDGCSTATYYNYDYEINSNGPCMDQVITSDLLGYIDDRCRIMVSLRLTGKLHEIDDDVICYVDGECSGVIDVSPEEIEEGNEEHSEPAATYLWVGIGGSITCLCCTLGNCALKAILGSL